MTEIRSQVQVPERQEHEPPASPEQLQHIRQLVEGMSLHGYRFDYRKLGQFQADSIIGQLAVLRGNQAPSAPTRRRGGGFLGGLLRKAVALAILGGIGYGVYYYFILDNELPFDLAALTGSDDEDESTDATAPKQGDNTAPLAGSNNNTEDPDDPQYRESHLFDGLRVPIRDDDENPQNPLENPNNPETDPTDPGTTAQPPVIDPTPAPSTAVNRELDALESVLVAYSQATREDRQLATRTIAVEGLRYQLANDLEPAMQFVEQAAPQLAARIRAVIERYGQADLDPQAIRAEIDAIRQALDALRPAE